MGEVTAVGIVPGPADAARELWFDTRRWPAFVDSFRTVVRADPDWPRSGALVWDSTPGGVGRTRETAVEPDVVEVDNETLRGRQQVAFEEGPGGDVRVSVRLTYELKQRNALTPVLDRLFVRRALRDSLTRTLRRFAAERRGDAADERG